MTDRHGPRLGRDAGGRTSTVALGRPPQLMPDRAERIGKMEDQINGGATVLAPEERRSVAEALRIPTGAAADRPGLRAVMVQDGRALVTDTYVAVNLPSLATLPEGAWDADALLGAVKGAGSDWVAIGRAGEALEVVRFNPSRAMTESAVRRDIADGVPSAWQIGTYGVRPVEGAAVTIHQIYADALAEVEEDTYRPDWMIAGFNPDLLARVFKARPGGFRKGSPAPVSILARGLRAAVVTEGDAPYAVVMPMRN